ncbi:peroxiredoxin family protein [Bacillus massiliigorillae]|uniref:peroxiredoxin family protein n=1 Tax=Bacillus massiliigorillae TaxID=1243664 RepID=UPI0003A23044|nr:TlpA disulfide reductase family protein [Bacillus massiliigorillae]
MIKKIISGFVLLLLISVAIVNAMEEKKEPNLPGLEVGEKAPNFTLENLKGEKVSLSDYKGQTVIVNFWATWCPPCRKEMPDLEKLYQQNNSNVEILAVNTDTNNDVASFVKSMNLTFPILLDHQADVSGQYDIISFPTTYIIDKKGVIVKKQIGELSFERLNEMMSEI